MNVIWIIADTLRREALGAYGNKKIHTPALDSLAAKSVRFDRHYAANFPTMPARADFLTGRWTMSFMFWEPLPEGQLVLPQLLSRKGINTAAFVDTPFYIRNGMNYDRGFQTFCEIPGQTNNLDQNPELRKLWRDESDRFAPQTFTQSMKWLERHYKEDFFLYIDTWDPHEPWEAPNYYTELYWPGYDGEQIEPVYGFWQDEPGFTEEKMKKAYATYCGEVTMVDTWVGYLLRHLENLNLMEKTAIIFTTDHGFYFGEHGGLFGKMGRTMGKDGKPVQLWDSEGKAAFDFEDELWSRSPLYEELTDIPLFIYTPGIQTGTFNGLTSAVDLMPTVMEIMGQEIPSFVEGRSLLPMMKDTSKPGRDFVVSTHQLVNIGESVRSVDDKSRKMSAASSTTITTDEWSLLYEVAPGQSELYHLTSDPAQEKNVISQYPDKASELHQLMVKLMQVTNAPPKALEPRLELRL
jgi:arylsulfatase A-like enzyme